MGTGIWRDADFGGAAAKGDAFLTVGCSLHAPQIGFQTARRNQVNHGGRRILRLFAVLKIISSHMYQYPMTKGRGRRQSTPTCYQLDLGHHILRVRCRTREIRGIFTIPCTRVPSILRIRTQRAGPACRQSRSRIRGFEGLLNELPAVMESGAVPASTQFTIAVRGSKLSSA